LKKISVYWSLLVGLLTVAIQVITFYMRFGRMNADSTFGDYILFFIAGTLGGLILIYFLNRQTSNAKRWVVLIAFLLATPVAMIFILGGGLLGGVGVILFPQIPWSLFMWVGSLVGKLVK
jgi:heme/copper-type cytochrome/quinol oxidase subunit 4